MNEETFPYQSGAERIRQRSIVLFWNEDYPRYLHRKGFNDATIATMIDCGLRAQRQKK